MVRRINGQPSYTDEFWALLWDKGELRFPSYKTIKKGHTTYRYKYLYHKDSDSCIGEDEIVYGYINFGFDIIVCFHDKAYTRADFMKELIEINNIDINRVV